MLGGNARAADRRGHGARDVLLPPSGRARHDRLARGAAGGASAWHGRGPGVDRRLRLGRGGVHDRDPGLRGVRHRRPARSHPGHRHRTDGTGPGSARTLRDAGCPDARRGASRCATSSSRTRRCAWASNCAPWSTSVDTTWSGDSIPPVGCAAVRSDPVPQRSDLLRPEHRRARHALGSRLRSGPAAGLCSGPPTASPGTPGRSGHPRRAQRHRHAQRRSPGARLASAPKPPARQVSSARLRDQRRTTRAAFQRQACSRPRRPRGRPADRQRCPGHGPP